MIQVWQFDTREKSKHESSPTPILLPEFLHPHSLPSHSCLVAIDEECYPQRLMQACLRLRGDWRRCPVETERCVKASERTLSVHVKIKLILRTNLFFTMFSDTHAWPGCVTPVHEGELTWRNEWRWRLEKREREMRNERREETRPLLSSVLLKSLNRDSLRHTHGGPSSASSGCCSSPILLKSHRLTLRSAEALARLKERYIKLSDRYGKNDHRQQGRRWAHIVGLIGDQASWRTSSVCDSREWSLACREKKRERKINFTNQAVRISTFGLRTHFEVTKIPHSNGLYSSEERALDVFWNFDIKSSVLETHLVCRSSADYVFVVWTESKSVDFTSMSLDSLLWSISILTSVPTEEIMSEFGGQ